MNKIIREKKKAPEKFGVINNKIIVLFSFSSLKKFI